MEQMLPEISIEITSFILNENETQGETNLQIIGPNAKLRRDLWLIVKCDFGKCWLFGEGLSLGKCWWERLRRVLGHREH